VHSPQFDLSESNRAFENAFILAIINRDDPWMYMYSSDHHDFFKNKDTKEYIKCLKEVKS